MSYATWTNFAYYEIGDIATYNNDAYYALVPNNNRVPTLLAPYWELLITTPSEAGIYEELTGGSLTATIFAPTALTTSVILLTYLHNGGGGGSQYINSVVPSAGSFVITCNTNIDLGDKINWLVVNP